LTCIKHTARAATSRRSGLAAAPRMA